MLKLTLVLAGVLTTAKCQEDIVNSFLKLKYGAEMAAKLFGIGNSETLGNMFTSTLQRLIGSSHTGPKGDSGGTNKKQEGFLRNGFLAAVVRSIGLNSNQMSAVAVNLAISIAQMISNAYVQNEMSLRRQKNSHHFSPFELVMDQSQATKLMIYMQDPHLVDRLLAEMNAKLESYSTKDVECIKLLVCKTSPFVWGMQKSLKFFKKRNVKYVEKNTKGDDGILKNNINQQYTKTKGHSQEYKKATTSGNTESNATIEKEEKQKDNDWDQSEPLQRMYMFLPTVTEVVKYGDICEDRFPSCIY